MPSTATSMLDGLSTSVAVKAPCVTVATANITLSGLQTVSGVALAEGDRVLAAGQDDATDNGIYVASTGDWSRALDADGNRDLRRGTRVIIRSDTIAGVEYELVSANPIIIGTTELDFELRYGANATYDQTAGEVAVSAVIINDYDHPGIVDRYVTNSSGVTDCTDAISKAAAVAQNFPGCPVELGRSAPYLTLSPINFTAMRGIIFRDFSASKGANNTPSLIVKHTGHAIDLSHSHEMKILHLVAANDPTVVPKSLVFGARNSVGSDSGAHRFYDIRTPSNSKWSHVFYMYGSELNVWDSCVLYNAQNGSSVININATNPSSYGSTFQTIATGEKSNAWHSIRDSALFNAGNSGSHNEVCVALERASDFSWDKGLAYCPNGLSYVSVGGVKGMNKLSLVDIRAETDAAASLIAAIAVRCSAATGVDECANWTLQNVQLESASGYLIDCNDTSHLTDLRIDGCRASSGGMGNFYSLSDSKIHNKSQIIVGRTGGTVQKTYFIGSKSAVTLSGTDTANGGFDTATGRHWETGDSYDPAAAACTGAITTSAQLSARKADGCVTLTLPQVLGTASAVASFTFANTLPANMRPPHNRRFPCVVTNAGAVQTVNGCISVTTAGVVSVLKDALGGAFTAAASAGLTDETDVSWKVS